VLVGYIAMFLLAVAAFVAFFFVVLVYLFYFKLVYGCATVTSKYLSTIEDIQKSEIDLPTVSIIINTYNEAKIIRRKIEDISRLDYPLENLEVIVVDDCSRDETGVIAEKAFADFRLKGKVLRNSKRLGLNASLNLAFDSASYDVVCVTDSDVMLDKDALRKAVLVLECFEDAGGVTGKVVPISSGATVASSAEDSYRSYYHLSMLSESSSHSAFPGNGPLIVFDKSLVTSSIPTDYGSTDANIAMNIVKSGKRFLYVPNALIYEPVPETVSQQKLQKVRRAKRLIQVFLHNLDVFGNKKYEKFGTMLFPLKFLVHVVCPLMAVLSLVFLSLFFVFTNVFVLQVGFVLLLSLFLVVLAVSSRSKSLFVSFVFHQVYLLLGLFSSFRKSVFWKTIDRK
jgi:cellulose synthase/poly-beta-1,6-N-acetylglucosamine synthase-like glycosyltransferase